jgi:hypothetical protein
MFLILFYLRTKQKEKKMNEFAVSLLEACFLNCYCASTNIVINKLNLLTRSRYDIKVHEQTNDYYTFKVGNLVYLTFMLKKHIVTKITLQSVVGAKTKKEAA